MIRTKCLTFLVLLAMVALVCGCNSSDPVFEDTVSPVSVDLTYLKDAEGRYIHLRGTNVGGSTKAPLAETEANVKELTEDDGRSFSYGGVNDVWVQPDGTVLNGAGRPFALDEADKWFSQLRELGFNSIRLLWIWESVYPVAKGEPDLDFLNYFEEIIAKAEQHGIYVLINAHENIWSRHLWSDYNENAPGVKGELDNMLWSLFPNDEGKYTDKVVGDGAPMWATRVCLPHKNWPKDDPMGYPPNWGTHRLLGRFNDAIGGYALTELGKALIDMGIDATEMIAEMKQQAPKTPFEITDTCDMLPWTFWGANVAVSLDAEQCYASFFAGDKVYPDVRVTEDGEVMHKDEVPDGVKAQTLSEYLQESYRDAWVEIAKRASKYPNVIGYDIMNEPTSVFILLTAAAAYFEAGLDSAVESILNQLLPAEEGEDPADGLGAQIWLLIKALEVLPPATTDDIKQKWGFAHANLMEIFNLNTAFDKNELQPLFEYVGAGILEVDPDAIIWLEPAFSASNLLGGEGGGVGGQWQSYMTSPNGLGQTIYSPHWYPDIYPTLGFNMPSREFRIDEYNHRDYSEMLMQKAGFSSFALNNAPVVFGEFGTYWNYRYLGEDPETPGYEQSRKYNYEISAQIMDNYYEAFEKHFMSNMNWCYTTDNDPVYGDRWNHEDFSIIDENGEPRGHMAYSRPYAKALSGKPISTHFYSDYHYYDPDKGTPDPFHEFEVVFMSKETDAPTIIYVPEHQYPDGFYVWLSDGWAAWDAEHRDLYVHLTADDPDWEHKVVIRPPIEGQEVEGFDYYIEGEYVITGK